MDIRYATGLTTILNASRGTLESIGGIIDEIIDQTT